MPYMLTYQTDDAKSDFHMCSDMDDALHMAEHFRNADDASDVTVYKAEEVKIEFKAYYKAEVDDMSPGGHDQLDQSVDATTVTSRAVPPEAVPRMPPIETPVAVQAGVIDSADSAMSHPETEPETEPAVASPGGDTTFGIFARS